MSQAVIMKWSLKICQTKKIGHLINKRNNINFWWPSGCITNPEKYLRYAVNGETLRLYTVKLSIIMNFINTHAHFQTQIFTYSHLCGFPFENETKTDFFLFENKTNKHGYFWIIINRARHFIKNSTKPMWTISWISVRKIELIKKWLITPMGHANNIYSR